MSLPLMFYRRDIITKHKQFVDPRIPSLTKALEPEEPFLGRIVVDGEKVTRISHDESKKESTRLIVNGENAKEVPVKKEAPKPKKSGRRVVV